MITREELLKQPEYWTAQTQIMLYDQAAKFMERNNMNRSQLAEYLGVSKGYVTQLLSGDYNHRMSKFFELALAIGLVPIVDFVPVENVIENDAQGSIKQLAAIVPTYDANNTKELCLVSRNWDNEQKINELNTNEEIPNVG